MDDQELDFTEVKEPDVSGVKEEEPKESEGGEGTPSPVTPPKLYPQEEVDTLIKGLKSDWDVKRLEHEKRFQKVSEDYNKLVDTVRQKSSEDFVRQSEEAGIDPNLVRQFVQSQEELYRHRRDVETREAGVVERELAAAAGIKHLAAQEFSQKWGVPVEPLMNAQTPLEMENMALKLALEKGKQDAKKPVKTASGVTTKPGVDFSKLSPSDQFAVAIAEADAQRQK